MGKNAEDKRVIIMVRDKHTAKDINLLFFISFHLNVIIDGKKI